VIKVLREALVVSNVHRVLGIVNGTTNFVLTEMEHGSSYDQALAEAQRLGFAEPDPTEDVSGKDAAAKMAILATVAFGSRVTLDDVSYVGLERVDQADVAAASAMGMVVRLIGAATLVGERWDVRVGPALVDRSHPLAAVEGAFNAVMLQGDAIREITLEGPGAGGIETASAVVADMVTIVGTTGTGFLQNDACWRNLERMPQGELASPFYLRVEVADRPGVLALVAMRLAAHGVSVARLVQDQGEGSATLHVVTHEAPSGQLRAALDEIDGLEETRSPASALPVVSDRGVAELGWA
jgi:homoserine dehydrogenase